MVSTPYLRLCRPSRGDVVLEANYLTFISLAYLSRNHENNITTNTTYTTTLFLLTYHPKLKEIIYVKCLEKGQA